MKQIISKIIVGIFNVLVPLFYILFIFAGLACAIVTSVIAYQTVKELFPKDAVVWIFSIPILIVISFEVTKVFIIFLNKQYSDSRNEKYLINKSWFLFLRGLLISISAIFTLLFTFYNLDNPELEARLAIDQATINKSFDKQRVDINGNYDRQILNLNTVYDNLSKPYQEEMKAQEKFRYSNGEFMGPLWDAANKNVQQFNGKRNEALTTNEKDRTTALTTMETDRIKALKNAEKTLKSDNSSSNKMLNAMLEVVTFNPNYDKGYYIFAIFILSILISSGLEFVIWGSFTVLAIEHGEFFASEMKRKTLEEQVKSGMATFDAMNQVEIKSLKKRLQDFGDAIINIVKRKTKDDVRKAKADVNKIDGEDEN